MICYIIAGLSWGDEAKGATCDFLCHSEKASLVIRYNGGCQAGHSVVTPDGRHHTFSQFGAGMFNPEVRTHLSRFMLVDPLTMITERKYLINIGIHNALGRTTVDPRAIIVTPYHRLLNRFRENSRHPNEKHGSCGIGIGECVLHSIQQPETVLRAGDLCDRNKTSHKLGGIFQYVFQEGSKIGGRIQDDLWKLGASKMVDDYQDWADLIGMQTDQEILWNSRNSTVVFEGAQGLLLDQTYGTAPHNTWSDCTFNNAKTLIEESKINADIYRIGCIRSYYTRHGAGPFPTEDSSLNYPEPHNSSDCFQGKFRQGHFDPVLCRYALQTLGGVEGIALSHLDVTDSSSPKAIGAKVNLIEKAVGCPVLFTAVGPTQNDRSRIKQWPRPIKTIPSSTPLDIMPDLKDLLMTPA